MWQHDFYFFYAASQQVLHGLSPSPLAVLFALLALLPKWLTYLLYLALNIGLMFRVMKWRMGWALLFLAGLAFIAALFISDQKHSWVITSLFQPLSNIYSAAELAAWFGPLEMLLSWLAIILIGGNIHSGAPMFRQSCRCSWVVVG